MKERGMIFNAEMVKAILEGRKTQTRRPIKPQPPCDCEYVINGAGSHAICRSIENNNLFVPPTAKSKDHRLKSPHGRVGDRIWVKELERERMRELLIVTNFGRILREYPDRWQYDNKDLGKLLKPTEVVVSVIMSEKKEG